jgi:hypothetical protein
MKTRARGVLKLGAVACLVVSAFLAGTAIGEDDMTLPRLQQAIDHLTNARALVDAAAPVKGARDAARARANIDRALGDVQKAIAANGG